MYFPKITSDQLLAHIEGKILSAPEDFLERMHAHRKNVCVVFTNGVFDLLHRGHLTYLMQARALGNVLVIGVNTDSSVKQLNKQGKRPIHPLSERLFLLACISWVDYVIPFSENTPVNLLMQIKPDIYVKGGDYTIEQLPETAVMQQLNGTVKILPFIDGYSSTKIINHILASQ